MPKSIDLRDSNPVSTPPAAGYVPTLRGKPPLPGNRPTAGKDVDWNLLTPREIATLKAKNVEPGSSATSNMVTLGDLPAEDQADVKAVFARPSISVEFTDDLGEVPQAAMDPALALAQSVTQGTLEYAEEKARQVASPTAESVTGAALPLEKCPHCSWPLDQPDEVVITEEDRTAYVEAILGERPFVKQYELFGGRARIVFRTLTLSETDELYAQVSREMDSGKLKTGRDFFERVQRLRLCLQLQQLVLPHANHELPDGLCSKTNPKAEAHWVLRPNQPPLEQVEEWLRVEVLAQESMFLTAGQACGEFNRLVSKLTAEANQANFFVPAAGGS